MHLTQAIQSILSQKFTNLELIAVDDASKDKSWKILNRFKALDKRVRVYKNLNHYGLSKTLNTAIRKARGEFIAFMTQESRSYVDRIGKQVSYLLSNPQIAAAGTQSAFVDEEGKVVSRSSYPTDPSKIEENLLSQNSLLFESFMINKKALPKDLLKFGEEDYPLLHSTLLMKICKYSKIANLDTSLMFYRLSSQIESNNKFLIAKFIANLRVWLAAFLLHDYRPSFRSLFTF